MILAAYGAILGGILRIGSAFIAYEPNHVALELLYGVIDVSILLGLAGFYVQEAPALGRIGVCGAAIAFCGQALIVGPDADLAGMNMYDLGVPIIIAGLAVLSIQIIRTRCYPARIGWIWLSIPLLSIGSAAAGFPEAGFLAGGILYGAGFASAGFALLAKRHAATMPA